MYELRRLLRAPAEQAGWTGFGTLTLRLPRDQTRLHYRNRANYSLQTMKTTILIDVEMLAIKDVHFTTLKS